MTTPRDPIATPCAPLALNAADGTVPDWVQLLPAGREIEGVDGRKWTLERDGADIVAAFNSRGLKLPIDIEHATQLKGARGEEAPAVGWIEALEARDTGLWGRADWTDRGRALLADRAYAYLSPVFTYAKRTGLIARMVSAGLTNNPNLDLVALNRSDDDAAQTEDVMDKAILEALGLNSDASAADVVVAIQKLKDDKATALNRAETPDPERFVPKADFDLAMNRVREAEAADKARAEAEIEAAVDAAIEAGKVAPASRDYHLAACRAEGGLDRFKAAMDAAPEIAGKSGLGGKPPAGGGSALSAEELAVCQATGMDPEEFAKARAAERKE